jgi:hypothetical protein
MAIQGALRELGIHDVFQLLDLSRKTGRLRVTSALRDNEGTVLFRDGRVVSATIRSNPHPLGAVLLRAGRITEQELQQARAAQQASETPRRLGEVLVELGIMSVRDMERFIRRQIETVIFELLSWQEGFFSFIETPIEPEGTEGLTSIPTECLLMEGARRLDEWTQIQQRVPHLGVIPALAEVGPAQPAPVLELLPNEWEVLAIIDGERDVRTLAATLGRSEFDVAKIVFGLLTTGVISLITTDDEATPSGAGDVAAALAEAREALATERITEALTAAASAVTAAPGNADARTLLARALFRSGREAEGEEELRLALEADALNIGALMEAARVAARRGQLGKAIRHWQQVVDASPDTPVAEQARHAAAHASRLVAVLEGADA